MELGLVDDEEASPLFGPEVEIESAIRTRVYLPKYAPYARKGSNNNGRCEDK